MGKNAAGITLLLTAAFIWGSAFVAQSVGMEYVKPATFNAVRFFVGALSLLPVIWVRSRFAGNATCSPAAGGGTLLSAGLACGCVLFAGATLQQTGIVYTTVGKAGFITTLYIIIVPILGLFMKKRVALHMWFCAAAAIVGLYLLCGGGDVSSVNRGDLLVLGCALLFSVHILLIDRYSPLVDGVKLSFLQFLTSGALSLVMALITEHPNLSSIWAARIPILFTGVISCGVGYTFQILGQKSVNPALASLLMSLESVFAALTGWIILKQALSPREIAGCLVIFAAIIYAQAPQKAPGRSQEQPGA
jgi:drug/metabolite transporter (DMT)-like permease